jgi:hypothetical protein
MTDSRVRHVNVSGLRLHLRRGEPNILWVNGQNALLINNLAAEFVEAFVEVMPRHPESLDGGNNWGRVHIFDSFQ